MDAEENSQEDDSRLDENIDTGLTHFSFITNLVLVYKSTEFKSQIKRRFVQAKKVLITIRII